MFMFIFLKKTDSDAESKIREQLTPEKKYKLLNIIAKAPPYIALAFFFIFSCRHLLSNIPPQWMQVGEWSILEMQAMNVGDLLLVDCGFQSLSGR